MTHHGPLPKFLIEKLGESTVRELVGINPNGDYCQIQDDILEAMSKDASMPVQLCDVLEILKAVP
jgi:hypothetical protein